MEMIYEMLCILILATSFSMFSDTESVWDIFESRVFHLFIDFFFVIIMVWALTSQAQRWEPDGSLHFHISNFFFDEFYFRSGDSSY